MRLRLVFIVLALSLMAFGTAATPASALPSGRVGSTLKLLNRERAQHGLPAFRLDSRLSTAAKRHAQDMVRRDYFSHDAPGGVDFVDRIRRTGYAASSLGENLAWGSGSLASPASTVRSWMNSPGHRANILNRRFRAVGIGIAAGAPGYGGSNSATYALEFGSR
jgi:uncharacterized protein YkwD